MIIYSLGSVNFTDVVESGLYIEEEYKWVGIGQSIRYGLAGNPVITENLRSGKPLTIVAQEDRGWLTQATVIALRTLASAINTTYILNLMNDSSVIENRTVMFKRDSYPLDVTPLDTAERYYVGSIHLIEV
jgi:hypothetical protein